MGVRPARVPAGLAPKAGALGAVWKENGQVLTSEAPRFLGFEKAMSREKLSKEIGRLFKKPREVVTYLRIYGTPPRIPYVFKVACEENIGLWIRRRKSR